MLLNPALIKTHAIAFIEFITDEEGRKRREGPRSEVEEMRINEEWKVNLFRDPSNALILIHVLQKKRDWEASKLRTQFEKKVSRYESYIDRLERRAGNLFHSPKNGASTTCLAKE